MGRIKTLLVKRITRELMDEHGDQFTSDFGKNKEMVNTLVDVPSKKIRNVIAGYSTRLAKKKGQKARPRRRPAERADY